VFGLDAAGGAIALLRQQGRGFSVGSINVPIAVQATTFDLLNGGDKDWGRMPPYWELGWQATQSASSDPFALGTAGGGYGATTATLKGGLGSASTTTASGFAVGAIVVVNAVGSAVIGEGRTSGPHPARWRRVRRLGQPRTCRPEPCACARRASCRHPRRSRSSPPTPS
jgi:D-aminopeptidase